MQCRSVALADLVGNLDDECHRGSTAASVTSGLDAAGLHRLIGHYYSEFTNPEHLVPQDGGSGP
jgi:hypothetical protein